MFLFWLRAGTTAFQKTATKLLLFFELCKFFSAFSANCVSFAENCIIAISQKSSTFAPQNEMTATNNNFNPYILCKTLITRHRHALFLVRA